MKINRSMKPLQSDVLDLATETQIAKIDQRNEKTIFAVI